MRILFLGDLAPTGFGTVTNDLGRQLLEQGADVRFVSHNETPDDLPEPFRSRAVNLTSLLWVQQGMAIGPNDGIPALFNGTSSTLMLNGEPYGSWIPDAAIILGDFTAARMFAGKFMDTFGATPTFHYVPIEGVGLPPAWKEMWDYCIPVAMSEFGADEIAKVMGTRPPVVYHGVDTSVFRPVSRDKPLTLAQPPMILTSKEDCKKVWVQHLMTENKVERIPRKWLLRTDSHWPRKRYNAMIRALAPVMARHPDWAFVIHCDPQGPGGYLPDTLSKLPPQVRSQFLLTWAPGIARDLLVTLYNAADIYVSTSAEGFGLTIAEAVACGVPAVGADYSAVPEVIGPAGKVVPAYLLDNEHDHYWCAVDDKELGRTVEHLMTHQTKREDLGRLGPAHVASNFCWEAAARQFLDIAQSTVSARTAA